MKSKCRQCLVVAVFSLTYRYSHYFSKLMNVRKLKHAEKNPSLIASRPLKLTKRKKKRKIKLKEEK